MLLPWAVRHGTTVCEEGGCWTEAQIILWALVAPVPGDSDGNGKPASANLNMKYGRMHAGDEPCYGNAIRKAVTFLASYLESSHKDGQEEVC